MPKTLDVDVVVVGAGPTGLMLANCLVKLGVSSVLLDGKSGPTRESRALVHHARTMEIYDQLGMADRVLAEAEVASELVPGFEARRFGSIDLQRLAGGVTPYPHLYVLEQSRTERLLVDQLERLGGRVLWSHPVREINLHADGRVECTTGGADIEVVRARYCVGADGSSSSVRELTGIPFEGKTNDHTFYVADAQHVEGLPAKSINLRFGVRDFLLAFPMGDEADHRLLGVVRGSADAVTESSTKETLRRVFHVTYASSRWFSTYRVHHRVAARFREGPVFLAGDAAHVHSPVGAQGMNTGLQDAHNLACKLGDVLAGTAGHAYLDRYGAERRPVARRLVSTTDAMFGVITSDRRIPRLLRGSVVRILAPIAASFVPRLVRSSRIFEYLSQTRIHYWMSDAARRASRGRRGKVVGRRLPWNGDNYESLRTMTWQVHAYGRLDRRRVKRVARQLGLPVQFFPRVASRRIRSGSCYLVRPDGFVAAESRVNRAAEEFAAHRRMISHG
ncbi:FAD-dependent monooxygenase [Microbacterium sp. CFBP9034]|uniref:FAD-dependent monooxygenase n=1 Tax=Microbacterium sp. CFBP9034 TaxID=3096540 RepID=UPI002A69D64F|nr:FAD-dependent monooxygenase [Microbacterium sp. CFBP9034]MDY0910712.1 FAD-dependent monooxygenase [Microbacterium sp. CFBP9034]